MAEVWVVAVVAVTVVVMGQVVGLSAVDTVRRTSGVHEVCQTEEFTAQCADDEVVMVTRALYGRMRIGKCVTTDYGHVGCYQDVLTETDRRCSGRHACHLRIPDAKFDATAPCPGEFKTYFEAEFSCLPVARVNTEMCQREDEITLTSQSGYISNVITEETGLGSSSCPWRISLFPGQRINVTLYDFSRPLLEDGRDVVFQSHRCTQYAMITEQTTGVRNVPICAEDTRVRNVYTSTTSRIDVRIVQPSQKRDEYFVLKYEVGCRNLDPQQHGWIRYEDGSERRLATIGCNYTTNTWVLLCDDTTWVGNRGNCTAGPAPDRLGMIVWGELSLPYGVSIGIIIGLAVIVGVIILLVGLICLEWKKMKPSEPEEDGSGGSAETGANRAAVKESQYVKQGEMLSHEARLSHSGALTSQVTTTAIRDNEYAYMREMWPLAPPAALINPPEGAGGERAATPGGVHKHPPPSYPYHSTNTTSNLSVSPDSELDEVHIYESPKSLRRASRDPHYFQLDPEVVRVRENGSVKGGRQVRMTINTSVRPNGGPDGESSPRTPENELHEGYRGCPVGHVTRDV